MHRALFSITKPHDLSAYSIGAARQKCEPCSERGASDEFKNWGLGFRGLGCKVLGSRAFRL